MVSAMVQVVRCTKKQEPLPVVIQDTGAVFTDNCIPIDVFPIHSDCHSGAVLADNCIPIDVVSTHFDTEIAQYNETIAF